jgi:hypothetical protein
VEDINLRKSIVTVSSTVILRIGGIDKVDKSVTSKLEENLLVRLNEGTPINFAEGSQIKKNGALGLLVFTRRMTGTAKVSFLIYIRTNQI